MSIIILVNRVKFIKRFLLVITLGFLLTWFVSDTKNVAPVVAEPIYQGNKNVQAIALTCNVFWGEEYIGRMLEILKEKNVKMTFFIGGTWAEKYPGLLKEIYDEGHEIGSHGFSHPHPDQMSVEANMQDITKAEKVITQITGKKVLLYAPPYGERGENVLRASQELGYSTILWSIDTVDWQRPAPDVIQNRVLTKLHNGAIVLMHPTAPTVAALPGIIDGIKEQGYQLVTVGKMLEQSANKID